MADLRSPLRTPRGTAGQHTAGPWTGDPDEAGRRGTLTVAGRVVERIAEAATLSVDGVARSAETAGTVESALGRAYPRIDCDVAGDRVRVEARIATHWPRPAASVAEEVRDHVVDRLRTLAAVEVDGIVVTVAKVVRPEAPQRRRVR